MEGTITDEERESWNAMFKLGFIFVIAGSAMLIALQGQASLVELAMVGLAGAGFGWLLLRYLLWAGKRSSTTNPGQRRRFK